MARAIINWTPAGGTNSTNQTVQYKLSTSSTWIDFSVESSSVTTKTITGLTLNAIYDFRIVDNCLVGGASGSSVFSGIVFSCPSIVVTNTYNSVTVNFSTTTLLSINKIVVQLLASDGTTIVGSQIISGLVNDHDYTTAFAGLSAATTYKARLVLFAGTGFIYTNNCSIETTITAAIPVCNAPSNVIATLS